MQVERILVNFNPVFRLRNRRRGLKRFSCFSRKRTDLSKKKLHSVCRLTKVYQSAKEERFWFFEPCHESAILVDFCMELLLNSRSKWWVETLLRKQRSKYTNPEGSNVPVSGLWFTVSGKIWKIEPIPEQTLKIVFTGRVPRSLYFSNIWFDLSNSRSGFKTRLRGVYFFLFCRLYHIV